MRSRLCFLAVAALVLPMALAYSDKGILELDHLTFSKVIDGSRDVLLRIDKQYPYGDEHDAYKKVAEAVGTSSADLLVASLGVPTYGEDKENAEIAKQYGVEERDWPAYALFTKGTAAGGRPVAYSGDKKSSDALLKWLAAKTDAFFGLKGQIKSFQDLAKQFMAADAAGRKALADRAAAEAAEASAANKEHAAFYAKVMARVLAQGDGYVDAESKRLTKMAADKSVAAGRKESFQARLNILDAFRPAAAAASKAEL